jgi:ATP-dependent RNA helicase SUPV3L1/SUV3
MEIRTSRNRILAVLGPTNTGKTHLAMERMLGHSSGMVGFPLRLLARENYDRAVKAVGRSRVALITGEEKIVPPLARYFLCTVESMPLQKPVSFLAIDEVQLCADADRGHIFTERLLGARGDEETMFLGSETIRPLIQRLVPGVEFITRPRFSTLSYAGNRKINRLPPRSVIVAFSVADVYTLAELTRRQRGGAAVVLGALSPRTRNAQVAMYQAGEVDYLIATDAIGMGLNMDVDHVAFAALRKFDGRTMRKLIPTELAQIGGRAGRHMNDGTFGTTAEAIAIDPESVARIENHQFEALTSIFWRNTQLRFDSISALQDSLAEAPGEPDLMRACEADDERALATLAAAPQISRLATASDTVHLLWEVCRIPDFRKSLSLDHSRLLSRIFLHLAEGEGRLPNDWIGDQVAHIDRTDGDIESLTARIADIRTWTYIAYRGDWLDAPDHWQERTRAVEDRLSDALHNRLTQRFVDRRTAVLVGRLKDHDRFIASVGISGEVMIEGHSVGQLSGFRFIPDGAEGDGAAARRVSSAALRALRDQIFARIKQFEMDRDDAFILRDDGAIDWRGDAIAQVIAGTEILNPGIKTITAELLEGPLVNRVRHRLATWMAVVISERLGILLAARRAGLTGPARGLIFQLCEALGSLPRRNASEQTNALSKVDRKALHKLGIRIGRESIYMPALLRPAALHLRAVLWSAAKGIAVPPIPPPGRVSITPDPTLPCDFYEAVGFRLMGPLALRIDIVERLAELAWDALQAKENSRGFAAEPAMLNLAGCGTADMQGILAALGFEGRIVGETLLYRRQRNSRKRINQNKHPNGRSARRRSPNATASSVSPFAKLRDLVTP